MFEVVKAARLRPNDLAKLLKVNRVTASMWLNGHSTPHFLLAPRVNELLGHIRSALDAGDLPVPDDVRRGERAHYIQTMIDKRSGETPSHAG